MAQSHHIIVCDQLSRKTTLSNVRYRPIADIGPYSITSSACSRLDAGMTSPSKHELLFNDPAFSAHGLYDVRQIAHPKKNLSSYPHLLSYRERVDTY